MTRTPETRKPGRAAPERIAALATLPVFYRLKGKRVVMVGESDGAVWKAELLAATGADVAVFAGGHADIFAPLAVSVAARMEEGFGAVTVHPRAVALADLAGAAMVIADIEDMAEAEAFAAAARALGVPVNIVDKPALCDFQFGSIVNRSPLIVSISTDGAAPVFGQAVRAKIEAMLPASFKGWAAAAHAWRPAVQALGLAYAARRTFWEKFTALALGNVSRAPTEADRAALMAGLAAPDAPKTGSVMLVGAGPGDAELLTLKALRALQSADVVLFDDLVSSDVLDLARREAIRIEAGKTGFGPSCKQEDISKMMVELALAGKRVVRLKSGDPLIFGRATEEIEACRAAGVPVEIAPGISAAQAAAASLGVSLTERRVARRVQFVTGHGETGKLPDDLDWSALADPRASTVVYMPRRSVGDLCRRALAAGLPPATPAVAVVNASRRDERQVFATVATLPAAVAATRDAGPMLILIGQAFRDRAAVAGQAWRFAAE